MFNPKMEVDGYDENTGENHQDKGFKAIQEMPQITYGCIKVNINLQI